MTNSSARSIAIPLIGFFFAIGCSRKKSELTWEMNFPVIGSQSSPRVADLNEDGISDIVIGAGKNEYQYCKQGILALDGKTGAVLWEQETQDQVYGSATFCDVTGDGIKDVFIGGRSPHLKALNGKTGQVIWAYDYHYEDDPILRYARFNFQNSVLIPDQNNDGLQDLLIANGGNSKAAPSTEEDRYPGVLMVFDTKTGGILAADTMPDGKESYMAPISFLQPGTNDPTIVFGTGGETIAGHLYVAKLSDLMNKRLSGAEIIATENGHGFIAPPVAVDINKDGYFDIVAISHASTVFAVDGKSLKPLWRQSIPDTESSNSFAVGNFTGDDVPDFFTFVSKGEWPDNTGSLEVLLDGKSGDVVYTESIGCTGFSSPVVYDLNNDGRDEAIISINEFDCGRGFVDQTLFEIENKLIAIDFKKRSVSTIDQAKGFKNIFTTPWIGDLDDDGYLDIVYCQYYSRSGLLVFLGMRVRRISTPVKVRRQPPTWGAYMGSGGNGVYGKDGTGE